MDNKNRKEELISLIKKFDNTCPDCGKLFLGALIEGSHKKGGYPLGVGINHYPLSCGKCPECAKKYYANLYEYVEINNSIPCLDYIIGEEGEDISDIKYELDCWKYLDKDTNSLGDLTIIEQWELIDLYDFFNDELKNVINEKDYD